MSVDEYLLLLTQAAMHVAAVSVVQHITAYMGKTNSANATGIATNLFFAILFTPIG